jgi:hypothetical protein
MSSDKNPTKDGHKYGPRAGTCHPSSDDPSPITTIHYAEVVAHRCELAPTSLLYDEIVLLSTICFCTDRIWPIRFATNSSDDDIVIVDGRKSSVCSQCQDFGAPGKTGCVAERN